MDENKYKKLVAIEVKAVKRRTFWLGVLTGVLLTLLVLGGTAGYFWFNRMQYAAKAADYVAADLLWNLFRHFPDGYVSQNREKFVDALDRFTNAASYGKITRSDFQKLSAQIMEGIRDRKLTYQEIDAMLEAMSQAAGSGAPATSP